MKKSILSAFALLSMNLILQPTDAQIGVPVHPDSASRYFVGTSEPPGEWMMPGFDDSSWSQGTGVIGYGYGFEDVPVDAEASSVYIRYRFNVEDVSSFFKGCLFADYDDGYIAYLNGKEIVRVNVDASIDRPAYNDLTNRSHRIQIYDWDIDYPVLGYYLDSLQLDSCLVEGENTLAFHVLNDSANGSDLQFLAALFDISYGYYNYYDWAFRYKKQYTPDSVSLPLVIIETDDLGIPYKNLRRKAFMGIIDNGPGKYNHPDDSCNVYYGDISIEVRGESSSEFPKRSYRFELIDSMEVDSNVALLGMPADDDWILLGPFHDKALFRNPMVFDMGRKQNGSYQPRNRYCEVSMNGEYLGVYSLLETIKRNNDRVNIARLNPDEISGNDLTGGYIMRYDKPQGALQIVYPKPDNIQTEQEAYIRGYVDEYTNVLKGRYFTDPEIGFRKYINDTSLVDYLVINEITKNADSYLYSTYMYKDRDDRDPRIYFGPLWDMNLAFGNSTFQYGDRTDGWQFDNGINLTLRITKLFQDTALVSLFQERWWNAREGCLSTDSLLYYIDSIVTFLEESRIRNYIVWPVIDEDLFYPNYRSMTYEEEIWNIKNWLLARLDWIDENIDDIYYPLYIPPIEVITEYPELSISYEIYPNPFNEELILDISASEDLKMTVEIFDVLGNLRYITAKEMFTGTTQLYLTDGPIRDLSAGIYLVRMSVNGNPVGIQRVVKQ